MKIWEKVLEIIREAGPKAAIQLPKRAIRKLIATRRVWFFIFEGSTEPSPCCVRLSSETAASLRDWSNFPWRDDKTFDRRFIEGASLYGLRKQGDWVSFGWVTISPQFHVGELGGRIAFQEPVLWIWDCVTLPGHRGKGYYPELLRGIVGAQPTPTPIIFCEADNLSSRRGITKAGFRLALKMTRHVAGTFAKKVSKLPSFIFSPETAN